MDFESLKGFLERDMRMSHIYQPAMLLTLLDHGGWASVREVAAGLLVHDQSQLEYYEQITKTMPGRVLKNRGVVEVDKRGARIEGYRLPGFETLSPTQIEELRALCKQRIDDYIERRGAAIWDHRRPAGDYIPGTARYEVLKRAGFHCELCGISADERALQVDHIVPRNRGGSNHPENLQALCVSCNASKRDRDDTDFRAVRRSFEHREADCVFCAPPADRQIAENELAYALLDGYPVTPLHALVIPKRHQADYFSLFQSEVNAVNALITEARHKIEERDPEVSGFNIGVNIGASAGQTVFHCHVHLIPRRNGDVTSPRGGVRHTIPDKGDYQEGT